ncbi:cytochrome P450 [Hyaloraphidium curvatum]|nr:cytochrome P450 [Hyaloraphidium curvatum]
MALDTFAIAFASAAAVAAALVARSAVHPVLLVLLFASGSYALLLRVFNGKWAPRKPTDPPLVAGWIPFLGVALEFGARGDEYLRQCAEENGPIFTLVLAGRTLTYVCDPNIFSGIVKDKRWGFVVVGAEVVKHVADIELSWSFAIEDDAHRVVAKWLLGDTATLTKRFSERADEFLAHEVTDGEALDLYRLSNRAVFLAGGKALFGTGIPLVGDEAEANCARFDAFDSAFPLFAGGLPSFLIPKAARDAKAGLIEALTPANISRTWSSFLKGVVGVSEDGARDETWDPKSVTLDQPSPYYVERHLNFLSKGLHEEDRSATGKLDLPLVWAATGNTGPAAYWTLRYILKGRDEGAAWFAELHKEIASSFEAGPDGVERYDPTVATPVLDGCVTEALRLSTSIFVIREAVNQTREGDPNALLRQSSSDPVPIPGTQYALPVGSRVVQPVRVAMHFNPALYGEDSSPTNVFDPMRHVEAGQSTTAKRTMPFGTGYSMCPGRKFAQNEIRCLVSVMLRRYDVELVDAGSDDFKPGRAGFGTQWPTRAARIRVKRRT